LKLHWKPLTSARAAQVKYIILVRPSALMSSMLVLLRPFTSIKAARKIRKVRDPEQQSRHVLKS
jgi:hypothetical protein